jgi:hypothetical protein
MSGVIHRKFHLDVIFLVEIFFSIDFNNVFLNRVQFSSIDFSRRFSDSNIVLVLSANPDIIYDLEIPPGMNDHNAIAYQVNLSVKRQKKPDSKAKKKKICVYGHPTYPNFC